jgi:hypothetical protein
MNGTVITPEKLADMKRLVKYIEDYQDFGSAYPLTTEQLLELREAKKELFNIINNLN